MFQLNPNAYISSIAYYGGDFIGQQGEYHIIFVIMHCHFFAFKICLQLMTIHSNLSGIIINFKNQSDSRIMLAQVLHLNIFIGAPVEILYHCGQTWCLVIDTDFGGSLNRKVISSGRDTTDGVTLLLATFCNLLYTSFSACA